MQVNATFISNLNILDKMYVFEEDNIVKGFMTIGDCRDDDKNNDTFELQGLYIDPIFQRKGIGTQFVKKCIDEARINSKKEITLWVFEKNHNSIEFYRKMGFEPDGKIMFKENVQNNAVRMKMVLGREQ